MTENLIGEWQNVGVHPTPAALARFFASAVVKEICSKFSVGSEISIVDACAGDGRLGHAVARRLLARGFFPQVTFVESNAERARVVRFAHSYSCQVLNLNFYDDGFRPRAQVFVSNPPYLTLSRQKASEFGLDWALVEGTGRNLYCLALLKCVDLCAPGGVVGFLGPHGWLTNQGAAGLRKAIARDVEETRIDAFSSRRLFPGVNQDVSVQIMTKRVSPGSEESVLMSAIGYDNAGRTKVAFASDTLNKNGPKVRVGLFVWNREKERISKRPSGVPIIYGGNINKDGTLHAEMERYRGRQYLLKSKVPASYVDAAPCIVVKRSMRGCPGRWKLDLAVVAKRGFKFVAENHVIVVPFSVGTKKSDMARVATLLRASVEDAHRHYGHPNVSVSLIRQEMGRILGLDATAAERKV